MTEEMQKSIQKIRELSPQLNAVANDANAAVARVDKFLQESNVGIEQRVLFKSKLITTADKHHNATEQRWYLEYTRVSGQCRIAITTCTCEVDRQLSFDTTQESPQDITPWANCSRELKLLAFGSLPKLLDAIAEAAEQQIKAATLTATAVDEIINAMNGKAD